MKAWIALGSNLNQPKQQILDACNEIDQLPYTKVIAGSKIYTSSPVGPQDQDDFVNGCILIETQYSPIELLDALQAIEQSHHRTRDRHWGPRTLDLDIILYDAIKLDTQRLIIPHPLAHKRLFVLLPLQDLQNNYPVTKLKNKNLTHWISLINDQEITTLNEFLI
ncbi:2-amino-4-hydroxy-6-hydroxymethyldihydropteridine diphosphokinase [Marinicellulosiphila megalodicopiae]|uniref:2-amino-4-hydroxy-6- hydroxymethyldihydropteridine diphosphokinase n=1 Tax=Marinicellulosiphila megalodicopiae TaxID=2724896 RepID=UPI003BB19629